MEIVVAMVGLSLGVLDGRMYTIIVLMTIMTSILAAPLLRLAVRRTPPAADEPGPPPARVTADAVSG